MTYHERVLALRAESKEPHLIFDSKIYLAKKNG